jgi:hypothetical protein
MRLETWTLTVKVTVDRDAIGGWTPQDVAHDIESGVSQMEGVANVECTSEGASGASCSVVIVQGKPRCFQSAAQFPGQGRNRETGQAGGCTSST